MKTLVLLLLVLVAAADSSAQVPSSFGTDFYAVFGLNQRNYPESPSFKLYIQSAFTTQVQVDVPALSFSSTVSVTAGSFVTVDLPHATSATVEVQTAAQVLSGLAVHITSQAPVSVIALNAKQFTADAFLVYPVQTLGTEYVIISSPTSFAGNIQYQTSSLFTIAATQDATTVTIVPAAATSDGKPAGAPVNYTMQRGDALMIMAAAGQSGDMTSTKVTADKPIAVFGGHERTEMPLGFTQPGGNSTSRDHLYEQLLPSTLAGDTLPIAMYDLTGLPPQHVRVIALEANTVIESNGLTLPIDSSGYLDSDPLVNSTVVKSNKPVVAGQYIHTVEDEQGFGDPSLALVLPTELYSRGLSFVSIPEAMFEKHCITILAQDTTPSIVVDGYTLPISILRRFPDANDHFSSVTIELPSGIHALASDVPISATAFGTGQVSSYAYNVGFGGTAHAAVREYAPATHKAKFAAFFDDNELLTIRSNIETSVHINFALYDIAGRKLYQSHKGLQLMAGKALATDYKREVHPSYLIIQEYDAAGRRIGYPVFLPVP